MKWLQRQWSRLFALKGRPEAIALGVAWGTFFGFIPLVGMKTLLAMGVTRLVKGQVVAAAIAVTLHDVILPVAPVILRWEYELGHWLLSRPHQFPPSLQKVHLSPLEWFHWETLFRVGLPLLTGSTVVAVPFGVAAYLVSLRLLRRSGSRPQEPG